MHGKLIAGIKIDINTFLRCLCALFRYQSWHDGG